MAVAHAFVLLSLWSTVVSARLIGAFTNSDFGPMFLANIDPANAKVSNPTYKSSNFTLFFSTPVTANVAKGIAFLPLMTQDEGWFLGSFDVSDENNSKLVKVYSSPYTVLIAQYDANTGNLFTMGMDVLNEGATLFFGILNPDTGDWQSTLNITGYVPAGSAFGAPYSFDALHHQLILSTIQSAKPFLSVIQVESWTVTHYPLNTNYLQALLTHPDTGVTYALAQDSTNGNLNWVTVDSSSGILTTVSAWTSKYLTFIVQGLILSNPANTTEAYAIMTSGMGPPAAIVTIDVLSGTLQSWSVFDHQPLLMVAV